MKFIFDNWMLIAVAVASGAMLLWPVIQGATATGLDPAGAVQLINRERGILIDVSNPDEFAAAHAKGAKNIPLPELEAKLADALVTVEKQKDEWLRAKAETDNVRKQGQNDVARAHKYAIERFAQAALICLLWLIIKRRSID